MATREEAKRMRDEEILEIVALIKNSKVPLRANEIADELGITKKRVWDLMNKYIQQTYPEITNKRSNEKGYYLGYIWEDPLDEQVEETAKEEIEKETTEEEIKEEDRKNSEGYPDPTASMAMVKFQTGKIRQGSIWETNGDTYFLVLSVVPGLANGLVVAKLDEWYDPEYDLTMLIGNDRYYINMRRMSNRPTKTLSRQYGMLDQKRLIKVKVSIGNMLNLNVETEKIVEKPVEVVKEVPVEKVIFKTKFDRKKLRKAGIKAYKPVDVEKYTELVRNAKEDALYWKHRHEVVLTRAEVWERAFKMMATGKEK